MNFLIKKEIGTIKMKGAKGNLIENNHKVDNTAIIFQLTEESKFQQVNGAENPSSTKIQGRVNNLKEIYIGINNKNSE